MYIVHVRVALATWTSQIDEPNADKPHADFYTQPTVCLERGVAPPTTTTEYRVALVVFFQSSNTLIFSTFRAHYFVL